MMKRRTANSTKWIKILSVIPILALLVYFFSEKVTAKAEEDKNSGVIAVNEDSSSQEKKEINILLRADGKIEVEGQIIEVAKLPELIGSKNNENTLARISANPGVGMGHLADVQKVLSEIEIRKVVYEGQSQGEQPAMWQDEMEAYYRDAYILVEDENIEYTHKKYADLTKEERGKLFYMGGAPEKNSPSQTDLETWKNKEEYALWLDGKVVTNETLEKYLPSDFVWVFKSRVFPNARSERFPQPYQVHLYSDKHFDETFGPNSEHSRPRNSGDTITLTQRMVTWNKDISRFPDPNTAFLQKNAKYEKLRKSGKAFIQKSQNEQEELNQLYQELNEEYSKSSDKRKKSINEPIPPQTENQKQVFTSNENSQTSLTAFGKLNGVYQVKLNQKGLFANKTDIEIKELFELYTALQEKYTALSYEDKRVTRWPTFPYARLEQDGKVIFKKFEDLTEEERKTQGC